MPLDTQNPEQYPPNIQAILKRPAPAAEFLGQAIQEVDVPAGRVVVTYQAADGHQNRFGAIHGGITAAMLDDAISLAAGLTAAWGDITPTLEMKVSYLSLAKPGMTLQARAQIIKRGQSILFAEATLSDMGTSKPIASCTATIFLTKMKQG